MNQAKCKRCYRTFQIRFPSYVSNPINFPIVFNQTRILNSSFLIHNFIYLSRFPRPVRATCHIDSPMFGSVFVNLNKSGRFTNS